MQNADTKPLTRRLGISTGTALADRPPLTLSPDTTTTGGGNGNGLYIERLPSTRYWRIDTLGVTKRSPARYIHYGCEGLASLSNSD